MWKLLLPKEISSSFGALVQNPHENTTTYLEPERRVTGKCFLNLHVQHQPMVGICPLHHPLHIFLLQIMQQLPSRGIPCVNQITVYELCSNRLAIHASKLAHTNEQRNWNRSFSETKSEAGEQLLTSFVLQNFQHQESQILHTRDGFRRLPSKQNICQVIKFSPTSISCRLKSKPATTKLSHHHSSFVPWCHGTVLGMKIESIPTIIETQEMSEN